MSKESLIEKGVGGEVGLQPYKVFIMITGN